jgi:16S rRNA (guanine527-N7)-methyltransferase
MLLSLSVSRETQEALERFTALLLRWNRTVNLVSRRDEHLLWDRHIADSLQLIPLIRPMPERAVDLGSGAGFPGLLLALVTGVTFDLIEADLRKATFLREAARVTGAPVHVHAVRIEVAKISPAQLVTARALAPLPRLLTLAAPLLTPDGTGLFLKGPGVTAELTQSAVQWHMQVDRFPSSTDSRACILRISNLSRAIPAG